jgi:hypothetical protein
MASLTWDLPERTRETEAVETPACFATSAIFFDNLGRYFGEIMKSITGKIVIDFTLPVKPQFFRAKAV